jgi:hypothetical protein
LRDEEVVSEKDYSRSPSVLKLVKFRLRWQAKSAISRLICWLSALWDRI